MIRPIPGVRGAHAYLYRGAEGIAIIDHAGAAFALCQETGARLAVHRDDAPYLQRGRPRNRMTLWGLAERLPGRLARYLISTAAGESSLLQDGQAAFACTPHPNRHSSSETYSITSVGSARHHGRSIIRIGAPGWRHGGSMGCASSRPTSATARRFLPQRISGCAPSSPSAVWCRRRNEPLDGVGFSS